MSSPEECREAIRKTHGGVATFRETVRVVDTFKGQVAWEGDVHVFALYGPKLATEVYAWPQEGKIVAVLKAGPVDGPLAAVRAAIAAEHRAE